MTKKLETILSIIGVIVALIALLFGDNIYQQVTGHSLYGKAQPAPTSEKPPAAEPSVVANQDISSVQMSNSQPAPTPPGLGDLVFDENFDNNNNVWPTGKNDGNYEVYLDNGEYHIIGEPNGLGMWFAPQQSANFTDFYLEAKTRRINDSKQSDDYGVYFRQSDLINYIFVINPDKQSYALLLDNMSTDQYTDLIHWVYSPRILKGFETNIIGILCKANNINIYINGYRIDSIQNSSSLSGSVGFVGGRREHVAFDYLRIWALK